MKSHIKTNRFVIFVSANSRVSNPTRPLGVSQKNGEKLISSKEEPHCPPLTTGRWPSLSLSLSLKGLRPFLRDAKSKLSFAFEYALYLFFAVLFSCVESC